MVIFGAGLCGAVFWTVTVARSDLRSVAATFGEFTAFWVLVAFLGVTYAGIRVWSRGRSALLRQAAAWGGRMCPRCHYPLKDLGENGTCPECGETFRVEDLVRTWRRMGAAGWMRDGGVGARDGG
jgi:uncharacterized paraquat-inducible protein A